MSSPVHEREDKLRGLTTSLEGMDKQLSEMELELEVYRTQYETNYEQIRHAFELEKQELEHNLL